MSVEIQYEEELTFHYLYKLLKKYKHSFIICPSLLLVAVFIFELLFVNPVYEASATIQIGQVNGKLLESSNVLAARMKDHYFIRDLIASNPDLFVDNNLIGLINKSFSQKVVAEELVNFTLRAPSRENALLVSEAVINLVQVLHDSTFKRNNHELLQHLDDVKGEIVSIKSKMLNLRNLKQHLNSDGMLIIEVNPESYLNDLIRMKRAMDLTQNPAVTYNTRLLVRVYVSPEPVPSNLILLCCAALFFGFMVTFLAALFRENLLIKDF